MIRGLKMTIPHESPVYMFHSTPAKQYELVTYKYSRGQLSLAHSETRLSAHKTKVPKMPSRPFSVSVHYLDWKDQDTYCDLFITV